MCLIAKLTARFALANHLWRWFKLTEILWFLLFVRIISFSTKKVKCGSEKCEKSPPFTKFLPLPLMQIQPLVSTWCFGARISKGSDTGGDGFNFKDGVKVVKLPNPMKCWKYVVVLYSSMKLEELIESLVAKDEKCLVALPIRFRSVSGLPNVTVSKLQELRRDQDQGYQLFMGLQSTGRWPRLPTCHYC